MKGTSRRSFLQRLCAAGALALHGKPASAKAPLHSKSLPGQPAPSSASRKKFIGIQIGAISFVDEGIEKALDTVQERAGANALMISVFTYSYGSEGRQQPGQFSDHGLQESNVATFHGGDYATVHPEYYKDVPFGGFRAPDLGSFDVFESVIPKARARGMQTFAWCEDQATPRYVTGFEQGAEVDVGGRSTGRMCLNNPYVRNFFAALEEDWIKSYPIDGILFGSERQGPLDNALQARYGGAKAPAGITCFCRYCTEKARAKGIDAGRAQEGYKALKRWVEAAASGAHPSDGYFVTFWRLLLRYPEIMAWEQFWSDNQHELYALLYRTAKRIRPSVRVGFHIWHNNSFSPFYRAEQDYGPLGHSADFLKPVVYNNCGGPRLAEYIRNVHSTVFRDIPPQELLDWHYDVLGYQGEADLARLPSAGLSARYVAEETARAVAGVENQIPIYPGIGINVPTGPGEKKAQPEDVRAAVQAALTSGAAGVILSRKYYEMRLANLGAAGDALRAFG